MNETPPRPELYTTILRVRNLEQSLEWYCRIFGLQPDLKDNQYRLAVLKGGTGQTIALRESPADHKITPSGLNSAYVVFMTPDADETHDRLAGQGEKVGSVQDHPGVRLFWLYDPDGHPLCVLQFVIDWGA
jgi:catechol 2,3-dioxygenase-like lactoylglutathione lyase family enzyme